MVIEKRKKIPASINIQGASRAVSLPSEANNRWQQRKRHTKKNCNHFETIWKDDQAMEEQNNNYHKNQEKI